MTVEDARGEGKLEGWVARIRAEQEQSARLANEFPDIWGNGENATWTVSTAPEPHRPLESGALERNNAARIPKRRVSAPSADFDRTAGQWMHEAHAKLERQSVKASRGRKTPNLPPEKYREIVEQTDKSKRNGEPRFPLKEVLSERVWKEIADYNTKAGTADKRLSQWRDVAFHRRFKRAVRHRYNRAEIHYRKYFVPQQS